MSEKFNRGLEILKKVDGKAGETIVENLGDLGTYVVDFAFGDIYSREGMNLRDREIVTIAALTVMGDVQAQLRLHLQGGLNVGLTRQEIEEIIIHTVPYAGFPRAINALNILKSIDKD